MAEKRPVNLNLLTMRFPVTAISSIGHRVTGVLLFLFLPMLLWLLSAALQSPDSFQALKQCLAHPTMRVLSWVLLVSIGYHVLAGLRHLLMDAHVIPTSFSAGKVSAWLVLAFAAFWAIYVGVWLW